LQAEHSNVRKVVPNSAGMIRASIIRVWHFGQAGRSIAGSGKTDDSNWESDMMASSNRRERNTLDPRGVRNMDGAAK
jgi:hypothetical protein